MNTVKAPKGAFTVSRLYKLRFHSRLGLFNDCQSDSIARLPADKISSVADEKLPMRVDRQG